MAENAAREESFGCAMQLVMGSVLPMTMQAANELRIFSIIAEAGCPSSASEIVSKLESKNQDSAVNKVDRILKLLAEHSVVDCTLDASKQQRLYSLNSVSNYFIKNEAGVSLAPLMSLIQDKVFLQSWSQLKDAVLEGGVPFDRVHGAHTFDYSGQDSRFNQIFNAAMFNHTSIVIQEALNSYKGFEQLRMVIDVGGGLGQTIKAITSKYPNIKGINFDLPHVIQQAPIIPRVEHVAGDMFECIPQGEAIFMKWILHDWNDERCLKLLKNCYEALPEEGKVIAMDAVAPVVAETTTSSKLTALVDVLMIAQDPDGKERTKDEFVALAIGAGFRAVKFECLVCNLWVMEFLK
ncbi:unnamed protein product [Linum trigynum]|uniref:caffeate O-methyltransferase n=1 Tax=Linum trigynum TaxID=586398 RepID=A0AAV2G434_9ROSI